MGETERMGATEVVYFKRFRMELDLHRTLPAPALPRDCTFVAWDPSLLSAHSAVKFQCFSGETDARIFPCLGDREGCERLMVQISGFRGFLPGATWLVRRGGEYVATVQGVRENRRLATIQNLGVVPEARGTGIGSALLLQALRGFRQAGVGRAILEVTAENIVALRMYRRVGFRRREVLYRAVAETRGR
jgi:ribosomal protein S18 acetylase RimI-like enzyme